MHSRDTVVALVGQCIGGNFKYKCACSGLCGGRPKSRGEGRPYRDPLRVEEGTDVGYVAALARALKDAC